MSETVRSFTRVTPGSYRSPRRSRRRKLLVWLLLLGAVAGVFAWSTRDSVPITRFYPKGQTFGAVLSNPVEHRDRIAASPIWRAVPESSLMSNVPSMLMENFGLPEWVLNNVVREQLFITSNDVESFNDVLCLTRMSRFGSMYERVLRWTGLVDFDSSGGLALRHLPDHGVYYAVRGRVLVASPSRDALIHALTLPPDACIAEADLASLSQSGPEDMQGILLVDRDDAFGRSVQYAGFAIRIDAKEARLKVRGVLREDAPEPFRTLVNEAQPASLVEPPPGMAGMSMNFGKPADAIWRGFLSAAGLERWPEAFDELMDDADVRNWPAVRDLLVSLAGPRGPGVRVTLARIDTDEFIPMPEIAATFDANREGIIEALAAADATDLAAHSWEMTPRYDAAIQRLYVPMAGGPSLEATAGATDEGLLLATSRRVGDDLLGRAYDHRTTAEPANVFLRIEPRSLVEQCVEAGRLLAEDGLLKNHTPESFEEAAAEWRRLAASIVSFWAVARAETGAFTADIRIVCQEGA